MTMLPTGEKLPDYDDGAADGADIIRIRDWVSRYGRCRDNLIVSGDPEGVIRDVLAALQAAGDATLVKNETYRAMRRDGADVERLAAHLANHGHADLLVDRDGNPVTAVIALLTPLG